MNRLFSVNKQNARIAKSLCNKACIPCIQYEDYIFHIAANTTISGTKEVDQAFIDTSVFPVYINAFANVYFKDDLLLEKGQSFILKGEGIKIYGYSLAQIEMENPDPCTLTIQTTKNRGALFSNPSSYNVIITTLNIAIDNSTLKSNNGWLIDNTGGNSTISLIHILNGLLSYNNTSGIVFNNKGIVDNCRFTGNITGDYCAGIVYNNIYNNNSLIPTQISNCVMEGECRHNYNSGICFDNNTSCIIHHCTLDSLVLNYSNGCGVCWTNDGVIDNCTFTQNIARHSNYGIASVNGKTGQIQYCQYNGIISGETSTGICYDNYGTVLLCGASGTLSGELSCGITYLNHSFTGDTAKEYGIINQCTISCDLTGLKSCGVCAENAGYITKCSQIGDLAGDYCSGICYVNQCIDIQDDVTKNTTGFWGGIVQNCYSVGTIGYKCAGIVIENAYQIIDCYSMGDIVGNYGTGICYYLNQHRGCSSYNQTLQECSDYIYCEDICIRNCYSRGEKRGTYSSGICYKSQDYTVIINCYSYGNVTGTTSAGIIWSSNNGGVSHCYTAGQITGTNASSIIYDVDGGSNLLLNTCNQSDVWMNQRAKWNEHNDEVNIVLFNYNLDIDPIWVINGEEPWELYSFTGVSAFASGITTPSIYIYEIP